MTTICHRLTQVLSLTHQSTQLESRRKKKPRCSSTASRLFSSEAAAQHSVLRSTPSRVSQKSTKTTQSRILTKSCLKSSLQTHRCQVLLQRFHCTLQTLWTSKSKTLSTNHRLKLMSKHLSKTKLQTITNH